MQYDPAPNIETTLRGLVLAACDVGIDTVTLSTVDGRTFSLYHSQDCCESVSIHDTKGEVDDLLGLPLANVQEHITSEQWPDDAPTSEYYESWTWTTFTFTTSKGTVVIRWLGQSNGYYSESVSFVETTVAA